MMGNIFMHRLLSADFFLKSRNVSQCDKCPQRHNFSRIDVKGQDQSHNDPKTVCHTPHPQSVSTHQIWVPYLI